MKRFACAATLLTGAALALAACSKPAEPVAFAEVCAAGTDKKTVVTEGYLRPGASIMCSNTGGGPVTCGLGLFDPQGGEKKISAYVEQGTGASEVEKPASGYKQGDLKLRADDSSLVGPNDRLRVTGRVTNGDNVCFLNISKIEKQ
ncbi:MAG TPA: hypothetical protein VF240_09500 [Pyrinomonadaceae bacterium]